MLLAILLAVAALSPSRIAPADVSGLVADAVTAASEVDATLAEAKLVATFSICESGGKSDVVGDSGAACSALQLHVEWRRGHTCQELRASRVLAMAVWIAGLRDAEAKCGSTARALGLIASGKCGAVPKLVYRRMNGRC